MSEIDLHVNGESHTVDVEPDTPLIYVLRNHLKLTGPKLGCGQEQCGACVVLVDGEATNSCVRAVSEFASTKIVTIEGLAEGSELSPVQKAFQDEGAAQCGYCTSGIIVATTALLNSNTQPSDDDIHEALHDHLCRCGSHRRVLTAISRLTEEGA
ncbi:MAG: (2Fe-2S)-binding protein [Rhodospirillales bacterium]|jgi:nicotinate dehydrogenase subunit A|nr:(2Fe-2S)-binding protein [Rhodospirillales bacterium]MDP7099934.1 (2Fe-2S)-binding protein [Rhodospirillales bacterium]MDP7425705.1 (2Fe-2S)-binding protein [Rhodospirillales bacterium]MDP7601653.1 (2Fe-2S)-binding protein [Rhodospirillales bacterium]|tara:strand:- start:21 stop:485 length:465 start_codon:yes stop_codon:yes gene_type:complete